MVYKISGTIFEVIGKFVPDNNSYVAQNFLDHSDRLRDFIINERIKYFNVSLNKINNVDSIGLGRKFSTVSFHGGKVFFPNRRLILTFDDSHEVSRLLNVEEQDVFFIDNPNKWGSTNYRIYSANDELNAFYQNKDRETDTSCVYLVLDRIVNLENFWIENSNKITLDFATLKTYRNIDYLGLNHIINGSHIELLSSNWLAHYINIDPVSFISIFRITNPGDLISVKREENNIDILVEFENDVVIIENKIKANIERKTGDYCCQLVKYWNYVETKYPNKNRKYLVLCPDYRKQIIKKQIQDIVNENPESSRALNDFEIINYSELKSVFMRNSKLSGAKYYTEFLDFIDDNSNYSAHYKRKKLSDKRLKHIISINL